MDHSNGSAQKFWMVIATTSYVEYNQFSRGVCKDKHLETWLNKSQFFMKVGNYGVSNLKE